ncbi:MAG: hypothetical protein RIS19_25 [Actinomycetota bacterium]
MRTANSLKALAITGLLLALAGCSTAEPEPTATLTPTPTPTVTQTQAEIEAEFYKLADDSCAKGQEEGLVERFINDEPSRIIALAKKDAYMDYSAIYIDNKGKAQVLYELETTACNPGYLISMMEEANHDNTGDYEHYVKKNKDGTFVWTQSTYSETGSKLADTIFEVADGLLVKAIPEDVKNTRSLEYGPVSDVDMQALKDAVDAEIERMNQ